MWLRTVYSEYTQYTSLRRIDSVSDADPSGYRHHATANDWVKVPVPMQKRGDWTYHDMMTIFRGFLLESLE
jgi:hypothetical protein